MTENCTICGEPLGDLRIGTGNGNAHRHCYARERPPRAAQSIYDMVRSVDDPMLAAMMIHEMVPPDLARSIVTAFNVQLIKNWRRRCEP